MPEPVTASIIAAVAPQTVVLIFGGAILFFVFVLTLKAIGTGKDDDQRKFIFSVIALLLGLFGGGGVGALVGGQSADNAAHSAATSAANSVKSQVGTVAENAANKAATNAVKSVRSVPLK